MTRPPRHRARQAWLVLVLFAALLGACATPSLVPLKEDRRFDHFRSLGKLVGLKLAVAPVRVPTNPQQEIDPEAPNHWRLTLDPNSVRTSVVALLNDEAPMSDNAFALTEAGIEREKVLAAARDRGADLLLEIDLREANIRYEGHNLWYYPNVLVWWYDYFIALLVADEEFAVEANGEVRLFATGSDQEILSQPVHLRASRRLNDIQRGIRFYSFRSVPHNFSPWNWRKVEALLRDDLLRGLDLELLRILEKELPSVPADPRLQTTLALCVGVGRHHQLLADPSKAADDARRFQELLLTGEQLPARNAVLLMDGQATQTAILDAVRKHLLSARQRDRVVFYFSGLGTAVRGQAMLVPYDFRLDDPQASGLPLQLLAATLRECRAEEILIILDAAFGPEACPRFLASGASAGDRDPFYPFSLDSRVTTLCATQQGGQAWNDSPGGGGLFSKFLRQALERGGSEGLPADRQGNGDGLVTPRELANYLRTAMKGQSVLADPACVAEQLPFIMEGQHADRPMTFGTPR